MQEFADFLRIKTQEMGVAFPLDKTTSEKVLAISGGLPLAIQWIIGRFRATRDIHSVLNDVRTEDSPVLEFSFRNIWNAISPDSQATLGVMTIFDSPPTAQQITIATEWPLERVEKALAELAEVTLVTPTVQSSDGQLVHSFLPITRSFALHQFNSMGEFETRCRQRFNKFSEQLRLQQSELYRFTSTFERYGLHTDNEKKGAILCTRGQSEMFSGNTDNADVLFKQARDIAPTCAYVFAMNASYEIAQNRVGRALEHANTACKLANKRTGSLCYTILARVMDVQRDRNGRVEALEKALAFDPADVVTRHQYGVALSRVGKTEAAIEEFTRIIEQEWSKPSATLLMALKTRIINLRRLGREAAADQDLKTAKKLISQNPFLQHQGRHFEETLE
jgi:tetratricopeptide (TPR) repeat protein